MKILHPSFGRLRAFADGEPIASRQRVAAHLSHCPECRRTVSSIRELKDAVRDATALPVPEDAWSKILARRSAGEQVILPAAPAAVASPRWSGLTLPGGRTLARAAVLVLGVAGIASATLPGSPIRSWWERIRESGPTVTGPPAAGTATTPPPGGEPSVAGISVAPRGGEVRVVMDGAHPGVQIRVRLFDGDQVEVEARGAAAGALFRTGPGRLGIAEAGPGEVRLSLPRTLRRGTLVVDGVPYLLKEGEQIRILAPEADTAGAEFVFSVRP